MHRERALPGGRLNRHKKTYDLVVVGLVVTCLALFVAVGMWRCPANPVTLRCAGWA